MIEKLIEDGMIINNETTSTYTVLFKGLDWLKQKGYRHKLKVEKRADRRVCLVNLFLIIGSIATTIIALIEIRKYFESHNMYHFPLSLFLI